MSIQLIYCTVPSEKEARELAKYLLDQKLIACANIFPAHLAVYSWKGQVQEEQEVAMLIKAPAERFSSIEAAILEKHSYDTPCIVALNAEDAYGPFGDWVQGQCQN